MSDITPREVIADGITDEATGFMDITSSEAHDLALGVLLALRDEYGTTVIKGHHYILVPHVGLDAYTPKQDRAA